MERNYLICKQMLRIHKTNQCLVVMKYKKQIQQFVTSLPSCLIISYVCVIPSFIFISFKVSFAEINITSCTLHFFLLHTISFNLVDLFQWIIQFSCKMNSYSMDDYALLAVELWRWWKSNMLLVKLISLI